MVLSADQFAENFLESSGADVKRSKLEGRNGILTWKWSLLASRPDEGMSTTTPRTRTEIRGRSISGGGDVAAKMEMIIYDTSCEDPSKTKMIGKVVRYTNILEARFPDPLNEDKLIDTGLIIIAQKLQECKNDIYVTMVSWGHCVTSEDRYITIVSTVMVAAVTYLGFEYRCCARW